jgi:hypothetical protein
MWDFPEIPRREAKDCSVFKSFRILAGGLSSWNGESGIRWAI